MACRSRPRPPVARHMRAPALQKGRTMRRIALRFAAMAPVLAALTACGGGGTSTSTSSSDSASSTADTTQAKTALETALETCNIFGEPWATLGDNNKTLTIDGAGKGDN